MNYLKSLSILLLCAAVFAVNANGDSQDVLRESTNKFSFNFFKELANQRKDANLLISPLSAYVALALTAEGTAGTTYDQVNQVLELPEKSISKAAFQKLINEFNVHGKVAVSTANKILVDDTFTVKPEFEKTAVDKFNSTFSKINRGDLKKTLTDVNKWANESTHGKISNLITEDDLKVKMLILNAVYFKAAWQQIFDEENTVRQLFNSNGVKKPVKTMYQEAKFDLGNLNNLKARFIDLPYEDESYKMTIILPNEDTDVHEVVKNLDSSVLQEMDQTRDYSKVRLYLPKFKIESSVDLKDSLKKLGLTNIFEDGVANFDNLTSGNHLYVEKVKQDAFIDVNEKGSEAAAITRIGVTDRSDDHAGEFRVDRPSVFLITKNKTIVFVGLLKNPVY